MEIIYGPPLRHKSLTKPTSPCRYETAAKARRGALGMARVSGGALSLLASQALPLFARICASSALWNF